MLKRTCLIILLACLAICLIGCNGDDKEVKAFFAPADLIDEATINQYADPDFDIAERKTFCILPLTIAVGSEYEAEFGNELLEKQMIYQLRNYLELMGYSFEPDPLKADLVATISGNNEYRSKYIPPHSITVPDYVPSQTVKVRTDQSGNVRAYGTYDSAYGYYSGTEETTIEIPGYYTTETINVPGRTVGWYYPDITINIFSTETNKSVWYANGYSRSNNSDIRVSCQQIVLEMITKLPTSDHAYELFDYHTGFQGIAFIPFTSNGGFVQPVIINVEKDSPAKKAGLKDYDVILSINGTRTMNKTFAEVAKLFDRPEGTAFELEIKRGKNIKNFTIGAKDK